MARPAECGAQSVRSAQVLAASTMHRQGWWRGGWQAGARVGGLGSGLGPGVARAQRHRCGPVDVAVVSGREAEV